MIKSGIKELLGIGVYRNLRNREIHSKYNGLEKCYILGCGPSINNLDLSTTRGEFCISVANFFEHPDIVSIDPKFHIFAPSHPPITETALENWFLRAESRLPEGTSILCAQKDKAVADRAFKRRTTYTYGCGGKLPIDFTRSIITPRSVVQIALQLGIYLNIRDIVILGVSSGWYILSGYSHFYSVDTPSLEYYLRREGIEVDYSGNPNPPKEVLYNIYGLYQAFETLKQAASDKNLSIFNGDPYSQFDVFPKVDIRGIEKS